MSNILQEILEAKRKRLQEEQKKLPLEELKKKIAFFPPKRDFLGAISTPGEINIIAEVKKASPSKGIICPDYRPSQLAQEYEKGGAKAISVLTEEDFFLGKLSHLEEVRKITDLPVLRKDFIFEEYQVYQSAFYGADAYLLIAHILDEEKLKFLVNLGEKLQMTPLVEVHNREDLEKTLRLDPLLIGINNRNLEDFSIHFEQSLNLKKLIPKEKIVVSESGLKTKKDLEILQEVGINAFLIGETLLRAENITQKLKEFLD